LTFLFSGPVLKPFFTRTKPGQNSRIFCGRSKQEADCAYF
jgi:hypothetical protein